MIRKLQNQWIDKYNWHNSVYKPLLVAGLRGLALLVALFYLDIKAH
jgi:hypothetical protein